MYFDGIKKWYCNIPLYLASLIFCPPFVLYMHYRLFKYHNPNATSTQFMYVNGIKKWYYNWILLIFSWPIPPLFLYIGYKILTIPKNVH